MKYWPLAVILAAYSCLAIAYSVVVPLFEAPDEVWHYEYVRWLAEGNGLPAPADVGAAPWAQEGSQPPLYYALGALLTAPVGTSNAAQVIRYNVHAVVGNAEGADNRNVLLHGRVHAWPWQGVTLAAHLTRFLSVLLGAITVAVSYALARAVAPGWPAAAPLAAAVVAFTPQYLFITASTNNDNLVTMLGTAGLYLCARVVGLARVPGWRWWAGLGLVVGLAALSKLSGLLLLPLIGVTILLVAYRQRSWRVLWRGTVIAGALFLLVAGWWYVRAWRLFGDPLLLSVMFAVLPPRADPATPAQVLAMLPGIWRSTWAVFGWFNLVAAEWLYWLYGGLTLAALAGWVFALAAARTSVRAAIRPAALGLVLLWCALTGVAVLRWAQMSYAQGRLLFPALGGFAVLLAGGLLAPWPALRRRWVAGVAASGFALIAALAPFLWIAPAYASPPLRVPSGEVPNLVNLRFGPAIRLAGYDVTPRQVTPRNTVAVTLYWQADGTPPTDYSVFLHATDTAGILQAQHDSHPGQGNFPTSEWRPGAIVVDRHLLTIPPGVPAPATLRIEAGLYDARSGERLAVGNADRVALADIGVAPAPGDLPNAGRVDFGGKLALAGYDLDRRHSAPGDSLTLTMWWDALGVMDRDYVAFAHLLLPPDAVWAQDDRLLERSGARTSAWRVGDRLQATYTLALPETAPPGIYHVEVGVYDKDTYERLPVGGSEQGVALARIKVE
ncbi:MAG: glycosyltransferase family 39 protein [Caldilineaceae bacterium]|nr:glycosyltransferase family 39 protein [Caldilineaceae bacterium]